MNKKIVLFDIDYTLFDTTRFKQLVADMLVSYVPHADVKLIDEVYYEVRQKGSFDPKLFAQLFTKKHALTVAEEEIESLWFDTDTIKKALYPEVLLTLQKLQERNNIALGIFSAGKTAFQLQKISSLSDFFETKHVHVAEFKEETLPELMRTYQREKVVLIDDLVTILHKAKLLKNDLFTIWIKRGKFALQAELPSGFEPDAIVTNLADVVSLLKD